MAESTIFKILANIDVTTPNSDTLVYTVPADSFLMGTLNLVNRNDASLEFRIASSQTDNATEAPDFVEYDADLLAYGTVERMGLVAQAGEHIIVRSSRANMTAVLWGSVTLAPNYVSGRGTGGPTLNSFSVANGDFAMAATAPASDTLLFTAIGANMDAYLDTLQGNEIMKIYYEEPGFGTFNQTNNWVSYNGSDQIVVSGPAINNINNKITRIDIQDL